MQRCQRLQTLQLDPAPDQDPAPDHTPDLTLEAAPAQDPENVAIGKSSPSFCFQPETSKVCFHLEGSFN